MSAPVLVPTQAQPETFGGVTYHIDGELVPVLAVDVNLMSVYFRASRSALEASGREHRHPADCRSVQAEGRRNADLRDRGERPRAAATANIVTTSSESAA